MKRVIIYESREHISKCIHHKLALKGYTDCRIITRIEDVKSIETTELLLTDITIANKVFEQFDTLKKEPQIKFYQIKNNSVTNFWNEGFFDMNEPILSDDKMMFIRSRGRLERLNKKDILYIESDKKYCTLITTTKKYVLRTALKNLYEQLKNDNFLRIHRSYLINKEHISYIDTHNQNILIGDKEISIGRYYQENLFNQIFVLQ